MLIPEIFEVAQYTVLHYISCHFLEFTVEPTDTVVQAGNSAVLDCVVKSDYPPNTINTQWQDQDRQMLTFIGDSYRSQLTNGSLYISSVSEEQGLTGNYQCMASLPNGAGSIVSRTAKLSLATLSEFIQEPRDLSVYPGQKAYFACRVQASPPPKIRWLKDERPLQLDELRMTVLPSGALEIDEVTELDQGSYRCNASGLNSYKLSNKAALYISDDREQGASKFPPHFIALPMRQVVIEGQNVTLDCAANGNPNPTVTWLKDGVSIDMADLDTRFSIVGTTTSLKITNILEIDTGTYQCRAENKEDSKEASTDIKVHVPPRFLSKPTDKVEDTNKDVELECSVYGVPEPKVQWLKNGEPVILNEYYQLVKGNNLKIMGLMASDTGIFQCVAANDAGNIQASASLKVVELDKERNKTKNRKKKYNTNNQKDEAIPFPEQQSRKLFTQLKSESANTNKNINPNQTSPYPNYDPHHILTSLRSSEAGDNNLGDTLSAYTESSPFSKHFTAEDYLDSRPMESVPGAPQDLKAPVVQPRFVILSWRPPDFNYEDIIAYSVYYRQENNKRERVQNTTNSRLEEINIRNLRPNCVYHFRVVAFNNYGSGQSSKSLTVTTVAEENVPSAPRKFTAYATSSHSITVNWEPSDTPNGHILKYVVYYVETASSAEHKVETTHLDFNIDGLTIFTEYNLFVVAVNEKGPGAASDERLVRTFSAPPTEPPSNVTFEPSSTSITVRWEPPPPEGRNGIITGYKIRCRKQGSKGDTATTASNLRSYILTNLERGSVYQIKLWAMNVNGTGPPTEWQHVNTLANDMDETTVPGTPFGLKVTQEINKVRVTWNPPPNQTIKIRNYWLSWGKGVPDSFSQQLDDKQRSFIFNNLEANAEYVISIRASNKVGYGPAAYATIRTTDEPQLANTLMPPVGLKAVVLSSATIILYWTDNTLSKSQYINDNRYYIVQYGATDKSTRNKNLNVSDLNVLIDDLKPNTMYDFRVKVVKGRKESSWSMVVSNKTFEIALSSAPRDLKIYATDDDSSVVELQWQPPKLQNGHVTGYIIFYTTDSSKKDRDWTVEAIKGDKHSYVIHELMPATIYYFKIQARNSRGYGPISSMVSFKTGENIRSSSDIRQGKDGRSMFSGNTLLYLIIGGCALAIITIAAVLAILCCRRQELSTQSPDRSKKGYQKALEKSHSNNDAASSSGAMTLPRSTGGNDFDTHENHHTNSLDKRTYGAMTLPRSTGGNDFDTHENHHTNSLDKRTYAPSSYMCVSSDDKSKRIVKPKPITLPVDSKPPREPIATATPINSTNISQASSDSTPSSRPPYPRTQYTIPRAHVTLDQNAMTSASVENPYASHPPHTYDHTNSTSGYSSQPPPVAHVPPTNSYAPGMSVLAESQAAKRVQGQGHPLKSFTVPAPPPISAPGTPQPKHVVRPSSSPYKKAPSSSSSTLTSTPPSRINSSNPPPHTAEEVQRLQPSHSTEELNQEMANLEGLMMTLNAITANEFEC
ncbi:Neogenin C-terminus [Popillia japonica]|uniref:Neogenin C-terminus n=1 Tax=Popillia japonica TaxID=7064 RepID=A0AAW1N0A5_POPJA